MPGTDRDKISSNCINKMGTCSPEIWRNYCFKEIISYVLKALNKRREDDRIKCLTRSVFWSLGFPSSVKKNDDAFNEWESLLHWAAQEKKVQNSNTGTVHQFLLSLANASSKKYF